MNTNEQKLARAIYLLKERHENASIAERASDGNSYQKIHIKKMMEYANLIDILQSIALEQKQ